MSSGKDGPQPLRRPASTFESRDHSDQGISEHQREIAEYDIRASQRPAVEDERAAGDESGAQRAEISPCNRSSQCSEQTKTDLQDHASANVHLHHQHHHGEEEEEGEQPCEKHSDYFEDVGGYRYTRQGSTIWVDFSPNSTKDPQLFKIFKKYYITAVAGVFTVFTSTNASSYAIGERSMMRDLNCTQTQAATGIALYAFGFGLFPIVLAPFSEECVVHFLHCHTRQ